MTSEFRTETRQLLHVAWPVILGQLGHVTVGVADSAMIGQTGTLPLAAAAFANSLFVIPLVFGIGVAYGITPLVANADGQGDRDRVGRLLSQGLLINSLLSIALMAVLWLIKPLAVHMGQDPEVITLALPYLGLLILGLFPLMIFLSLKQFAEGLSDTRPAMLISLGANVVNVALNYAMIYGHWGFPAMGLMGAGYATLISRILMALSMYAYMALHPRFVIYRTELLPRRFEMARIRRILALGIPSGLQYIFEVGAFATAAVFIGQLGALPLAAHQIAISLASISYMAASGIGAAATVRIGNAQGRQDVAAIRRVGMVALFLVCIIMSLAGLTFALGNRFFPSLYNSDPEVILLSAQLLIIAVFFQLSDGIQVVGLGLLRGLADVRMPTFITFFSYWVIALPLSYVWGLHYLGGVGAIWICLAIGLTLSAALLMRRFHRLSRLA